MKKVYFSRHSLVAKHSLGKGETVSPILTDGSIKAKVAQLVEQSLRKGKVASSILAFGSKIFFKNSFNKNS
jgi:hypothetical protein